jgi:hypothetical protein
MEAFLVWAASVVSWLQLNWERIPKALRTIINVCVGAGIAAVVKQVVTGGDTDLNTLVNIFLVAAGTVLWRAINPADASYGLGGGKVVTGEIVLSDQSPDLGEEPATPIEVDPVPPVAGDEELG